MANKIVKYIRLNRGLDIPIPFREFVKFQQELLEKYPDTYVEVTDFVEGDLYKHVSLVLKGYD